MTDLAADLQLLAQLHATRALTDEEFQAAKAACIEAEKRANALSPTTVDGPSGSADVRSGSSCPVCGKDDQVTRVSHVAASGTSSIALGGSMHGGGRAQTRARTTGYRTWNPFDLDHWYTLNASSVSSFEFAASISLSGGSATTLAAALTPPVEPDPIPEGSETRYQAYFGRIREVYSASYYCPRDATVFVARSEQPPIEPSDYRTFLQYEGLREVYERGSDLDLEPVRVLEGRPYSLSIPSTWDWTRDADTTLTGCLASPAPRKLSAPRCPQVSDPTYPCSRNPGL